MFLRLASTVFSRCVTCPHILTTRSTHGPWRNPSNTKNSIRTTYSTSASQAATSRTTISGHDTANGPIPPRPTQHGLPNWLSAKLSKKPVPASPAKVSPSPPKPSRQILVRVKKPVPHPLLSTRPTFATLTSRIEYDIYTHGLSSTLANYRARWIARGNTTAWPIFGKHL